MSNNRQSCRCENFSVEQVVTNKKKKTRKLVREGGGVRTLLTLPLEQRLQWLLSVRRLLQEWDWCKGILPGKLFAVLVMTTTKQKKQNKTQKTNKKK